MSPFATVVAALALLAVPSTPPASAVDAAYCEPGRGSVAGSVTYNPLTPVTANLQTGRLWTITVDATCTGSPAAAGHYQFTIQGKGAESCTEGGGFGEFVTGSRDGVPVDLAPVGSYAYGRAVGANAAGKSVVHFWGYPPHGSGQFYVNGNGYTWYLWFDLIGDCPNTGGPMVAPHMAVYTG